MGKSVDWMFRMIDRVSQPASAIRSRLEAVERTVQRVESVTKRSGGAFGGWARQGEQGARRVEQAFERVQKRVSATHQQFQGLSQVLQTGAFVGGAVLGGAGYLLGKALGGMGTREGSLESLSVLLKTRNQAQVKAAASWVDQFADITPFQDTDVMNSVRQLLAAQFKFKDVQGIARITGDAASALGSNTADAAFKWEVINRALGQIQAKGRLQGDEILQLNEAGIGTDKYLKAAFGKDYRKLQEAGKISGTAAINAILKGLDEEFGGAMDRMSKTFSGLTSTLASRPQRLMGMLFDAGGLDAPKKVLENLVTLTDFSRPPGSLIARRFTRLGKQLMDSLFGPLADATSGNAGVDTLNRALDQIEAAGRWWSVNGPTVMANVKGFGEGLKAAADGALLLVKPLGWIVDKVSALTGGSGSGGVGKVLGFLAGGALIGKAANLLTLGGAGKAAGWVGRTLLGGVKGAMGSFLTRGVLGEILTNPAGKLAGLRAALTGVGAAGTAGSAAIPVIGWVITLLTTMDQLGKRLYGTFEGFTKVIDFLSEAFKRLKFAMPVDMRTLQAFGLALLRGEGWGGALKAAAGAITGLPMTGPTAAPAAGPGGSASIAALTGVAQRLGIDPQALLAVAFKESSLNPAALNSASGASGLIQFLPSTAKGLGTTADAIRAMTPEQQAPYIERYLRQAGVGAGSSLEQIYAAVFAGSASKTGRVLYTQQDGKAYTDNAGLDLNKDGQITSQEAALAAANAWQASAGTFAPNLTVNLYGPTTPQAVQDISTGVHGALTTIALEQGSGGRQ
ncbi:tape measure protein [Deinococcus radiotolerans]|uniref:Transglycosylase SLT domain-containing protein n=1 Tax=Deinococcus radiotolerans TaxID=1309407 RepID=A0ABQ2FQA6_9DEIO|nr:tape measure protein [Deinococcus radiotolerans]GGL15917.1 hypothetical protein GCM10010844_38520 [Deinococcus radiotolerans]